jgi:hypothetical protein
MTPWSPTPISRLKISSPGRSSGPSRERRSGERSGDGPLAPTVDTPGSWAGGALFPVEPDAIRGTPIAFLAGDPIAHHESLSDVRNA